MCGTQAYKFAQGVPQVAEMALRRRDPCENELPSGLQVACICAGPLCAGPLQNVGAAWEIVSAHIQGEQEACSGGRGFGRPGDVQGT